MKNTLSAQDYIKLLRRKINELKIVSKEGFFKSLTYSITYSEITELESSLVESTVLSAVLLKFRPFYLQQESLNFLKVCNFFEKNTNLIGVDDLKRLREWREAWTKLKSYKSLNLILNSQEEDWFDLWLYGENYHLEIEKVKKIALVRNTDVEHLSELIFLEKLQKYVIILLAVDEQIFSKI